MSREISGEIASNQSPKIGSKTTRGAGAVRIKSPRAVAYLYPGLFKCEEMRDECRPFPSNGSAVAGGSRGASRLLRVPAEIRVSKKKERKRERRR